MLRQCFKSLLHHPRALQIAHKSSFKPGDAAKRISDLLLDRLPEKAPQHKKPRKIPRIHQDSPPSLIYFQVIGQGTPGGPRSLFMYTNHGKFMFNCGEGTQRLCTEYCGGRTLSQLTDIFITRRTWDNLGGLPGMYLSIRAVGAPDVTIHGPKGTIDIYHGLKPFMANISFAVLKTDSSDPTFDNEGFTIKHIDISPSKQAKKIYPAQMKYTDWSPVRSQAFMNTGRSIQKTNEVSTINDLSQPYDETVTAYLITCKPQKADLVWDKCNDLGITSHLYIRELKAGNDVVLDDGTTVTSKEVMAEALPPQCYIVIEIPSLEHLRSLEQEPELQPGKNLQNIEGIFHFTPPEIMQSEGYIKWMESFPKTVSHIAINEDGTGYESQDLMEFNAKLHIVNPAVFPKLSSDVNPKKSKTGLQLSKGHLIQQAMLNQRLLVRGDESESTSKTYKLDLKALKKDILEIPKVSRMVTSIERDIANSDIKDCFPKTTFLGTGSAMPSKYRCVSSILIETKPDSYILLDCGEGTVHQLHRRFGRLKTQKILRNLKAVYISHLHADHHLGFIALARSRNEAFGAEQPTRLYVVAPSRMSEYLMMYHCKFEPILQDLYQIKNEHLLPVAFGDSTELHQRIYANVLTDMLYYCGFEDFETRKAFHCPGSFSMAFTIEGGYKIVYSGDTRPTDDLIKMGKKKRRPNLLIHEATAEHYLLADCKLKRHSTFTEAIEDGERMDAEFIMLTHFSQRYSKMPIFDEFEGKKNVGIAWDFLTVNPSTYHLVAKSYPALREIFKEDYEEMLMRKEQYQYKNGIDNVLQVTHRGKQIYKNLNFDL